MEPGHWVNNFDRFQSGQGSVCQFLSSAVCMIQVRYCKGPYMQNSMRKLKLTLALVLTLTDTGGAVLTLMLGYRSLYTLRGNSCHLR